ncbi:MAG: hypothetical protein U0263_35375 [Polyangiaceae bacterium]
MVDRAKSEATTYAVEELGARLCAKEDTKKNSAQENFLRSLFPTSCGVLQAKGFELTESSLLRLRKALVADLTLMPGRLLDEWKALNKSLSPEQLAGWVLARSAADVAALVVLGRLAVPEIPRKWAEETEKQYLKLAEQQRLQCSLKNDKFAPACAGLLAPELSVAVLDVAQGPSQTPEQIAAAIERAAQKFCKVYGPPADRENGACLLVPEYQKWRDTFTQLAKAGERLIKLRQVVDKLTSEGTPPAEIARRVLPDVAAALDGIVDLLPGTAQKAAKVTTMALHAAAATLDRDYAQAISILLESTSDQQELAGIQLPAPAVRALEFAARLATAKDRDDAKKAIEDEALPLGSYKVKYDRSEVTIAVNAFVGAFAGYQTQFRRHDDGKAGFAARPLSAPLGVDFTLMSSKYWHFGVLAAVIDPFAAGTVDDTGKAQELDWGALLTPGVHFRVGVGGSPFTLLGGVTWQPLTRSPDDCETSGDGNHAGAARAQVRVRSPSTCRYSGSK